MIVHCPSCGIGIDADADAELAMAAACADRDAAIRELAAVRAELAAERGRVMDPVAYLVDDGRNMAAFTNRDSAAEYAVDMQRWNGGVIPRLVPLVAASKLSAALRGACRCRDNAARYRAERDAERERADHAERLFLTAHDMATELQCVLFGASVLPAEIHADIEAMRERRER